MFNSLLEQWYSINQSLTFLNRNFFHIFQTFKIEPDYLNYCKLTKQDSELGDGEKIYYSAFRCIIHLHFCTGLFLKGVKNGFQWYKYSILN